MTRRADEFLEFLERRSAHAQWKILNARETMLDPALPSTPSVNDALAAYRDAVLDELNDFFDDIRDAHATDISSRAITPDLVERLERLAQLAET